MHHLLVLTSSVLFFPGIFEPHQNLFWWPRVCIKAVWTCARRVRFFLATSKLTGTPPGSFGLRRHLSWRLGNASKCCLASSKRTTVCLRAAKMHRNMPWWFRSASIPSRRFRNPSQLDLVVWACTRAHSGAFWTYRNVPRRLQMQLEKFGKVWQFEGWKV